MAFEANNQKNSIDSDKSQNGSFGKNDSHSVINTTVQTGSTTKATTSCKPQELGYLHSRTVRDSRDTLSNNNFNNTDTPNIDHGVMPESELDTTSTSNGLSPRSKLRNLRNKIDLNASLNLIPNENYYNVDPEDTLNSNCNNDTTLRETLHSTPNGSNQYNHLGA